MKISEIMTKEPCILSEDATILEAIKEMESTDCGILPIGNEENIEGVITDRDIVMRAVAKNKDLNNTLVKEIMTKEVVCCEEDSELEEAVMQMSECSIRRILVKNGQHKLSGIVSLGDIIRRVKDKTLLAKIFNETAIA